MHAREKHNEVKIGVVDSKRQKGCVKLRLQRGGGF